MAKSAQGALARPVSRRAYAARNARLELRRLGGDIRKSWKSYLFLLPFGLTFLVFTIIPVITSIVLSFSYYNILEPPQFVGWLNYVNLLCKDDIFLIAVKNTFLFAAITGPVGYIASFFMAWLINEQGRAIRTLLTFILYAPTLSGQIYMIWQVFFSGDVYGYANGVLMSLGVISEPIQWLTDSNYMMGAVIVVILWMSLGTSFLVFIAGLQTLPVSYYEAALVDGIRNRWQELWYITLPQMKPQLMFGAVMSITNSFAIFDQVNNLVGFPSADYAAHTIVAHLVDYGTVRYDLGYASAIATILFIIMVGCNKGVQKLLQKVGK